MEIIHRRCAGLDVHKKTVMVCVRLLDATDELVTHTRGFSTMTFDLRALADWLISLGVTHVAMESTGVFWKPIYNVMEGRFQILLCNAQHVSRVPGRKTDIKDCEWLAQLLQYGLLQASFVPERPLRELRDLTRHRTSVKNDLTRTVNRIHKVLEDANIKLGSVATDIMGVSGSAILKALVEGEDEPKKLSALARGQLKKKRSALEVSLEGHVTDHHRYMLGSLLRQAKNLEEIIADLSKRIREHMSQSRPGGGVVPFDEAARRLVRMTGLAELSSQNIIAEIGTDMSKFPSERHISSWTGICPGNHESAGKQRSGATRKGNPWLRRSLVQAAWATARTQSYYGAQFRQIMRRRGKKRAAVAVAHSILIAVYHMLARNTEYVDIGADHFDRLGSDHIARRLLRRLEALGLKVTIENVA